MNGFWLVVGRDLALARRQGGESGLALLFFVLGTVLFPLGIGPETQMLARAGAGLLWIMALLAVLLSLERLFQTDFEDGSLDLLIMAPLAASLTVLAKCLAHWLATGLPMVVTAPLLAIMLAMDPAGLGALTLAMLLATPTLSLIGAIGAALTVGARRGGVLLTLLVLPLYIPVLIFGAGAVEASVAGPGAKGHFMILGALLLMAATLAPPAAAAALRHALE
ncbi:MAG: heme exporter protein CcmB [Alphaproteobacteria bacterium]|nr:heme exporter protein CcmB [Alphaproteobacteria bacterium]